MLDYYCIGRNDEGHSVMGAIILQGMHLFAHKSTMVTKPGVGTGSMSFLESPAKTTTAAKHANITQINMKYFVFVMNYPLKLFGILSVCKYSSPF
jgi:hypothetical protein